MIKLAFIVVDFSYVYFDINCDFHNSHICVATSTTILIPLKLNSGRFYPIPGSKTRKNPSHTWRMRLPLKEEGAGFPTFSQQNPPLPQCGRARRILPMPKS
jgi:hypothetical protein